MRANAPGVSIGASVNAEGTASVQIRGKNTLSAGSDPLYVLDGVIFNGDLSDINPMDVQSIDVLKTPVLSLYMVQKQRMELLPLLRKRVRPANLLSTSIRTLGGCRLIRFRKW